MGLTLVFQLLLNVLISQSLTTASPQGFRWSILCFYPQCLAPGVCGTVVHPQLSGAVATASPHLSSEIDKIEPSTTGSPQTGQNFTNKSSSVPSLLEQGNWELSFGHSRPRFCYTEEGMGQGQVKTSQYYHDVKCVFFLD